jgi:hypothetical protein
MPDVLPNRPGRAVAYRIACGFVLLSLAGEPAAQQQDPDWPCIQRKVPHLSVAQLWSGPPVPEDADWRQDAEIARLAALLAARRTELDEARPLVVSVAPADGQSRDQRLLALFAGVFETIDRERARIIAAIGRYADSQRRLAEQIDARDSTLREAEAAAEPDDHDAQDRIERMQDELAWAIRIYQDRQRSLGFVCESPVILEQRAFAVARMIEAELGL